MPEKEILQFPLSQNPDMVERFQTTHEYIKNVYRHSKGESDSTLKKKINDQFSLILFSIVQTTYFHPATRWRTCTTGSSTSVGWRMRSSSKNSSEHDMQYKMIVMIVYTQLYMQTCFPCAWFDWFDGRVIEERVRNQEWSGRVKDTREKMNKLYDENRY